MSLSAKEPIVNTDLLSVLFQKVEAGLCLLDGEGRIVRTNKRWLDYAGTTPQDALGASILQVLPHSRKILEPLLVHVRTGGDVEVDQDGRGASEEGMGWQTSILSTQHEGATHLLLVVEAVQEETTDQTCEDEKPTEEAIPMACQTYQALVEAAPVAIVATDREGRVVVWNPAAETIFGWSREEVTGRPNPYVPEERRAEFLAYRERSLRGESFVGFETRRQKKDGSLVEVSISRAGIYDSQGRVSHIVAIISDITEHKRAEEALKESEERYLALLEAIDDAVNVKDREGRYLMVNSEQTRRMGRPREEIIGKTPWEVHETDRAREVMAQHREVLRAGASSDTEMEFLGASGVGVRLVRRIPFPDSSGQVVGVVTVSRDITELARMREELRQQSLRDDLTGLYNRRGFLALAEHQLKLATRGDGGIALLFADLDGLKRINDTFGHQEGDRALAAVASVLREACRETDLIARLGGDEFAVLAANTSRQGAASMRARLEAALAARNQGSLLPYLLSLSIGLVHVDGRSPRSVEELLVRADSLMYQEKRWRSQT